MSFSLIKAIFETQGQCLDPLVSSWYQLKGQYPFPLEKLASSRMSLDSPGDFQQLQP